MSQIASKCEVVYLDKEGSEQRCEPRNAGGIPFHEYQRPIRLPAAYPKQRHLSGHYFFSSSGKLILCESRMEMMSLMRMDFDPRVIEVAAQPFRLTYERDGRDRNHVPDYFAKLEDGRELVVDVKPAVFANRPRNKKIFRITAEICEQAKWLYKVDTGIGEPLLSNIRWLAGYKRVPNVKDFELYANAIVDYCKDKSRSIKFLLEKTENPQAVKPVLFYMLWKQIVLVPMDEPITDRTAVSLPDRGRITQYAE